MLAADQVGKYIERGHGGIYWSTEDRRGLSPIELVRRATREFPEIFVQALNKISLVDQLTLEGIIEQGSDGLDVHGRTPTRTCVIDVQSSGTSKAIAMTMKTLFLAWQDKEKTRGWFPIGRLDVEMVESRYRFRYTHGAELAHEKARFPTLVDFPEMNRAYEASELFPLFKNRVITPGRPDFLDYLKAT